MKIRNTTQKFRCPMQRINMMFLKNCLKLIKIWNSFAENYIGNFATYDTHMCCLSYENHMKNICVSYAYLIIWVLYVANHMRIIWTSICWSYAAKYIWFSYNLPYIWDQYESFECIHMRIVWNRSVMAIYLFIILKYYVFHPIQWSFRFVVDLLMKP